MIIIHISDSHLGEEESFTQHGAIVAARTRRVIAEINRIVPELVPASLVLHTGDVVRDPFPEAYARAQAIYSECSLPVVFLPGNHDDHEMLRSAFPPPPEIFRPLADRHYFGSLQCGEVELILLEALAAPKLWCGTLPADQLAALPALLERSDCPCMIALHYPPRPMRCEWADERMMLLEGDELHRIIRAHGRGRVKAVLFGHTHRTMTLSRDGILYAGVASVAARFVTFPGQGEPIVDPHPYAAFHVISWSEGDLSIQMHTVPGE